MAEAAAKAGGEAETGGGDMKVRRLVEKRDSG